MRQWLFAAGLLAFLGFSLILPETAPAKKIIVPLQLDSSWHHENDSNDGIAVYSRQREGSRMREILAKSRIDAPVAELLKVISDYGSYPEDMRIK
jgi:hypothetical protein